MKSNKFNRVVATALTFVMTFMMISPALIFANAPKMEEKSNSRENSLSVRARVLAAIKNRDDRQQFSPDELEQMRTALFALLDSNQELSATLAPPTDGKSANAFTSETTDDSYRSARKMIQKMSDKDLTALRKVINPAKMQAKLNTSRASFSDYRNSVMKASADLRNTPGLPGIDSYCGAPVSTGLIIAADVVFFAAEAVRDIAQDVCNEVIVAVGGGNTRLACLVTDAIYIIAKAVNQAIHFCDDDYAASVGQASFDRLGHIHDDLADSKANDNTNYANILNDAAVNTTTITTAVTNAKNTIVSNDNAYTTTIVNNDNTNENTIVANDNANTLALTTLINNALTAIINNANANKDELKNLILRTQIEADLSSTDGSTFVALYETGSTVCTASFATPITQCGYLDLVRIIVSETIVNQGNDKNALKDLATGDAQRAAGQFKSAYTTYRKAYKSAAK